MTAPTHMTWMKNPEPFTDRRWGITRIRGRIIIDVPIAHLAIAARRESRFVFNDGQTSRWFLRANLPW